MRIRTVTPKEIVRRHVMNNSLYKLFSLIIARKLSREQNDPSGC